MHFHRTGKAENSEKNLYLYSVFLIVGASTEIVRPYGKFEEKASPQNEQAQTQQTLEGK
jgi:hypothetical protein